MDRLDHYREIVRSLIAQYASYKPSNGEIEPEAVMDLVKDHYEVIHSGWDGQMRVHGSVVHVDIKGGPEGVQVWVQHDATNRPIAEELVAAGIPKEDIVLAFHPAHLRKHTGYATGEG